MSKLSERKTRYQIASKAIESLSEEEINMLLLQGEQCHKGIGGTGVKLTIDSVPIFAKVIPLTELELSHKFSTKNLFNLPTFYQYGVGSSGFGGWRELKSHQMTSDWVLNDLCENFPLMYGFTIIEKSNPQNMSNLNDYVKYWGGSQAIERKMTELINSKQSLVVFLEYIPFTLRTHREKLNCNVIEEEIFKVTKFLESKDMIHFDCHSRNILTDGESLYLSDFGLATSLDFELSNEEIAFFHKNKGYDFAIGADAICYNSSSRRTEAMSPQLQFLQDKYKDIAQIFHKFITDLRDDETKNIQYPQQEIDQLLVELGYR
jgi:hypothetical protein